MSNLKKILLAMLAFFAMLYFALSYYYTDVQINKYENKAVVIENQIIKKGWVPAILPESAYKIVETHDIDTNTLFGSFNYKEQDEATFIQQLTVKPDMNNTLEWKNFLFQVDKEKNYVKFRNKPSS